MTGLVDGPLGVPPSSEREKSVVVAWRWACAGSGSATASTQSAASVSAPRARGTARRARRAIGVTIGSNAGKRQMFGLSPDVGAATPIGYARLARDDP